MTKRKTPDHLSKRPRIGKLIKPKTALPERVALAIEEDHLAQLAAKIRPAPAMLHRPKNSMVVPAATQEEIDMIINGPGGTITHSEVDRVMHGRATQRAAREVVRRRHEENRAVAAKLNARRIARNFRLQAKIRAALPWLTRLGLAHLPYSNPPQAAIALRVVHAMCKAMFKADYGHVLPYPEISLALYREVEVGGVIFRDCVKKGRPKRSCVDGPENTPEKAFQQILGLPNTMRSTLLRILALDIVNHPVWGQGDRRRDGHMVLFLIGEQLARSPELPTY